MIYATEKSLKELGDKVDAETKGKVESEIASLKKFWKARTPRPSSREPSR